MNNQEAFTKAFIGLYKQGFQRSVSGSSCKLRGEHGMKCAVGQLISDQEFRKIGETGVWLVKHCLPETFRDVDASFLSDLQYAHDCGMSPDEMEDRLKTVAIHYELKVPTRDECNAA